MTGEKLRLRSYRRIKQNFFSSGAAVLAQLTVVALTRPLSLNPATPLKSIVSRGLMRDHASGLGRGHLAIGGI